jgi:hypothetical protein
MNNKNGFVGSSLLFDWCFLWSNSHDALGIRYTDSQSDNAKRYTLRNLGFAIGIPERNCIVNPLYGFHNRITQSVMHCEIRYTDSQSESGNSRIASVRGSYRPT